MPPGGGGGGGGERCSTAQDHTPAPVGRDEDALPHSTPPMPAITVVASQEEKQREQQQPVARSLPEGPLVEILARVPYRSLCRFKCVSKPWLALCSSRDIRKRSPQTFSGFFYYHADGLKFNNLCGRGLPLVDPSLPFLRESYKRVYVKHFCDGLLLCICIKQCSMGHTTDVVVCNPATEEWTVLPPIVLPTQDTNKLLDFSPICLGFDAAYPSRFVVFVPMAYCGIDSGKVGIYSSDSGEWTYVQNKWASGTTLIDHNRRTRVFLHGIMHLTTLHESILTVDTEGKVWRQIKLPDDSLSCTEIVCLGQSQGLLYAWQIDNHHDCQLSIWVIEDYNTGKWTLKHSVNVLELFGRSHKDGYAYMMFAIHPDCNVIYLTDLKKMTVSYDLDNQEGHVMSTEFIYGMPYIPCFAELPSAGH